MSARRVVATSVAVGLFGVVAGMAIGEVRPVLAQRIDPAYSAGTFHISAGNQNEAWRVNTSTGETYRCLGTPGGVHCTRAEFK